MLQDKYGFNELPIQDHYNPLDKLDKNLCPIRLIYRALGIKTGKSKEVS